MKIFETKKQIFDFLEKKTLKNYKTLYFLGFLSSVMEILGVTSVLPFFSLILNPLYIEQSKFINFIYNYFGFYENSKFVIFVGTASLIFFVFGSSCMLINTIYQIKFTNKLIRDVKNMLLKKYMSTNFVSYKNNNSANSISKIISQVDEVINGVILCPLVIFTRTLSILFLIIILFYFNFLITFFILFFVALIYFFILVKIKKKTDSTSYVFYNSNIKSLQFANEALKLFKEVYFKLEKKFFLKRFKNQTDEVLKAKNFIRLAPKISRYGLEITAISSALILSILLIYYYGTLNKYLPLLSFFVLASYKIFPNINEIFGNIIQYKSQKESFINLHKDISKNIIIDLEKNKDIYREKKHLKKSIFISEVTFKYNEKIILDNISMDINKNNKIIIVGKTGSGKSTLSDIISGHLKPTKGKILFDDEDINADDAYKWQNTIGYVSQTVPIINDNFYINISLTDNFEKEKVHAAAKIAEIDSFISSLKENYNSTINESGKNLSGGQIQRIGIARALYQNPQIIIFDEGTSNLDLITEKKIFDTLDKLSKDKTIIIITHRIETISSLDKYFILKNGKITNQGNSVIELKNNYSKFV